MLERQVEQAVLNEVVRNARERGLSKLVGEYIIATPRNGMVAQHYHKLGFDALAGESRCGEGQWVLDLARFKSFAVQMEIAN